jgi:hypothetical protein
MRKRKILLNKKIKYNQKMDTQTLTARTEFAAAINQICSERGISPEIVLNAINNAKILFSLDL